MKKKIAVIAAVLVLALALCACGAAKGYTLKVVDNTGAPVAGVQLQVCDDASCTLVTTDAIGTAVYGGEEKDYEVHVYSVPDGYSDDGTIVPISALGEYSITINKAA